MIQHAIMKISNQIFKDLVDHFKQNITIKYKAKSLHL